MHESHGTNFDWPPTDLTTIHDYLEGRLSNHHYRRYPGRFIEQTTRKDCVRKRFVSSLADFAMRMVDYGVKRLLWVDESLKEERTCMRLYGYGRRGEDAQRAGPF
jgi:hypothetical protein